MLRFWHLLNLLFGKTGAFGDKGNVEGCLGLRGEGDGDDAGAFGDRDFRVGVDLAGSDFLGAGRQRRGGGEGCEDETERCHCVYHSIAIYYLCFRSGMKNRIFYPVGFNFDASG